MKQPSFTRLSNATQFIERCLDAGETEALISACDDRPGYPDIDPVREHRLRGITALARFHSDTRISAACKELEFPTDEWSFSVGGITWGCVGVFFRRSESKWFIQHIGITRS